MRPFLPHRPSLTQEIGATLHLAAPIALAFVAQLGMGVTDTIMLGALGRDSLAAGGLGANSFFTTCSIVQGVMSAVAILIAHARGAGQEARIAPILRAGYAISLLSALPLIAVLWFADPLLRALGEPAALASRAAAYVRVLVPATPAFIWLAVQRSFLSAMAKPRIILTVSLSALVMNAVLNYGLIHGRFGLPAFGYIGSAMATGITIWVQVAAMSLGMRLTKSLPRARIFGRVDWASAWELVKLGWPIGITVGVETGVFYAGTLLMGIIGPTALAAHQVSLQVAATLFMVPLGVGQAANVRVGCHSGAGAARAAQRAGYVALAIGATFSLVTASGIASFAHRIVMLFGLNEARPADAEVIALATRLLLICAIFQVADGAQTIALGALRGLKDTRTPMIAASCGYWLVGFPAAYILSLPLGLGGIGVWWGLALGLFVVALLLVWRFHLVGNSARDGARIEAAARMAFGPAIA